MEGWQGWDEYAPFYDWENARTLGRRDVPFWTRVARQARGRVLELGCGTGRVTLPLARAGVDLVGIDRSAAMLARLRSAAKRAGFDGASRSRVEAGTRPAGSPRDSNGSLVLVRGDVRALPFGSGRFSAVIAPYGILQPLIRDRDLVHALDSVGRVLVRGGTFGIDLVPDVPDWREYDNRVKLRGRGGRGGHVTLIESVQQDRRRQLTTFTERYVERRGPLRTESRFVLTFRTLSVAQMARRLERAGFAVDAVLGDYHGRRWDQRAEVWIILARRV